MKLKDIVSQLQVLMPKYTSRLSDNISISAISVASNVATITTSSNHSLTTGDPVTISNVSVKTPINSVSQSGNLFTFTTSTPHDLTLGWQETISFEGFTDSLWNSKFSITSVANRNTFTVKSSNTIPTLNSNETMLENRQDGVNGRYSIIVTSLNVFTVTGTFIDGAYTGGNIVKNVRVAGSASVERAIEQYTENNLSDFWCIVVMNDIDVSKDRNSFSDATATKTTSDDIRMKIIDSFSVTFISTVNDEIAGIDAIDICRHDLFQPLMRSLYGARFNTGLTGEMDYKTIPTGAGLALYTKAMIVYTYQFEVPYELISGDSVQELDSRAFRDIDYTNNIGVDDTVNSTVIPIKLDT